MTWLLRALTLVVLVAGMVAGSGVSASAAQASSAAGAVVNQAAIPNDQEVTGESWSAPALPVDCKQTAETVQCTPENSDDNVETACYSGVMTGSSGYVTVCSSAGANQQALDNSGTKLDYQWGCKFGDLVCSTLEGSAELLSAEALNMSARAAAALRFNTDNLLWTVALEQWSFWAWAVLVVVLVAGIIAITRAAATGSTSDVLWAIVRTGLTFPLIQLTLWLLGRVLNAIDLLVFSIFADADLFGTMNTMLFGAGGTVHPLGGILATGLVFIAALVIFVVLTIRNIGIALLVMVGPIAWMLFPLQQVGKEWIVRYASALGALLLTGPIMMSAFKFVTDGLSSVSSVWDPRVWPFMLTLIGLCFAPLAVFSLFSFAGGSAVDAAAGSATRTAGSAGVRAARAVPRPRVGQSPAGVGASASSASRSGGRAGSTAGRASGAGSGAAQPAPARPASPSGAGAAPSGGGAAAAAPQTRAALRQSEGGQKPPRPNGGAR